MPRDVSEQAEREATELARAHLSDRYCRMDKLERYVRGTQYDGLPDFYNPAPEVPLLERAPNIVDSLVEGAIRQHVDFALGEGRFPVVTCAATADEKILAPEEAVPDEEAQRFDAAIRLLMEHAQFQRSAHYAFAAGEESGTAVSVISVRDGQPQVESLSAKWCTPKFSERGALESVEVSYPFIRPETLQNGKRTLAVYLYRRCIDAQRDVVYKPARIARASDAPAWVEDQARSATHGLGFVPVVWYARQLRCPTEEQCDGYALHASQLDEVDALNFALSQRGRAALYAGDPQMVETGVDESVGGSPVANARPTVRPLTDARGRQVHQDAVGPDGSSRPNPRDHYVIGMSAPQRPTRKKGAGTVWQYESPEADVKMLTLPGDALDAIDKHCKDLEQRICAVLGYTQATPETVRGALSGKALSLLFSRTTSYCDGARTDFWAGWMRPALSMLLRILAKLGEKIYIPGAKRIAESLRKYDRAVEGQTETTWLGPSMRAVWPRYFGLSAEEEKATVDLTATAFEAGLITRGLAVAKLKAVFPHESSEALAEELEEDHDSEPESKDAASLAAENKQALAEDEDEAGPDSSPPSSQDAPPSTSRSPTAAKVPESVERR